MPIDFSEYRALLVSDLKPQMHSEEDMQAIINFNASHQSISLGSVDWRKLLITICEMESSFGRHCFPRFEAAYAPNGIYYQESPQLKALWKFWGIFSAMSFGPFQVLYVNAVEHGFDVKNMPLELCDGVISARYACAYIKDCFTRGAKSVNKLLRCFNGGAGAFKHPNARALSYASKGEIIYSGLT